MIEFHYELDFKLANEAEHSDWVNKIAVSETAEITCLSYIFCTDEYLLEKNQQFLKHDTYTDVISFDYSEGRLISGDIFISIDRLQENSDKYKIDLNEEILRVMAHGLLHLLGYNDKNEADSALMRIKENEKIEMFHVEQ